MTRVSNKRLEEKVLRRIHRRFAESAASMQSPRAAESFLGELLSESEQLMLAKRLAAIYMIAEQVSSYRIAKTLGLSISTVLRFQAKYHRGEYVHILTTYHAKKKIWWKDIEALLRLGMPEQGKGRWKWLDDIEKKHR